MRRRPSDPAFDADRSKPAVGALSFRVAGACGIAARDDECTTVRRDLGEAIAVQDARARSPRWCRRGRVHPHAPNGARQAGAGPARIGFDHGHLRSGALHERARCRRRPTRRAHERSAAWHGTKRLEAGRVDPLEHARHLAVHAVVDGDGVGEAVGARSIVELGPRDQLGRVGGRPVGEQFLDSQGIRIRSVAVGAERRIGRRG